MYSAGTTLIDHFDSTHPLRKENYCARTRIIPATTAYFGGGNSSGDENNMAKRIGKFGALLMGDRFHETLHIFYIFCVCGDRDRIGICVLQHGVYAMKG